MEKERIKNFAIDILGCGCDNSVFARIDHRKNFYLPSGITLTSRVLIGDRLLIYIVDEEDISSGDLRAIFLDGLQERDSLNYNRLRVVILTDNIINCENRFRRIYEDFDFKDEKTHLHIVERALWN
ncbi:MAG TPA: hypothetical protein PKX79_12175 [Spirochaetota bacterium]|jgi:hypothetical protein|nr:hypothetical protein [Spirochaetota bacterium]HOK93554.1 hypothetical protein [Spirochaetota bacterium]HON17297.1 hypothetical protein [Spirochaetota bacterium]HPD76837.1 hypothetical protein [Spirochaetota bacterium]HPP96124.1 hypothetical protein [Spirochaetota bacterium]